MKLEVFSDPLWIIGGEEGVESAQLSEVVDYDTNLLKPALLVADTVSLRSWRLDTRKQEMYRANLAGWPVPAKGLLRMVVRQGPELAAKDLDIDGEMFGQLVEFSAQSSDDMAPTTEWWMDPLLRTFLDRWIDARRRVYDGLSAPLIDKLEAEGILEQNPWDERRARSIPDVHWYEDTTDDYAWSSMLAALSASSDAIMLDAGVQSRLPALDVPTPVSATELRRMADLMLMISALATAPLDEVVDIREELRGQLLPFRTFLLDIARSSEIAQADSAAEANRQLQLAWETRVIPSVAELEDSIRGDSFLRQLAREAMSTSGVLLSLGVGVVGTVAAGPLGITALSGVGTATLPLLTRAIQATAAAKRARQENPVFFVLEAQKRLGK